MTKDHTLKISGEEFYIMQPGDRIVRGPNNHGRMLETLSGEVLPWGTFISASRAEAIRKSRKRKRPAKKAAERTRQ